MTRGGEWKVAGNITELLSYLAPSPPPKTGPHRYVFVLLVSKGGNDLTVGSTELKLPKERAHWGYGKVGKGVREWAKDNNLVVVGKFAEKSTCSMAKSDERMHGGFKEIIRL